MPLVGVHADLKVAVRDELNGQVGQGAEGIDQPLCGHRNGGAGGRAVRLKLYGHGLYDRNLEVGGTQPQRIPGALKENAFQNGHGAL